jgi:1-acyl-sn-glycerol-3-phosphate acyltransferase
MNGAFFKRFSLRKAIQESIYRAGRLVCLLLTKVVFDLRVEGREHIPQSGGAILAANHVSFMDPVILGVAAWRPLHFMAKEELFRCRPFGWLLRLFHAFPVDRRRTDLQAMKRAISLVREGEIVLIFPEGTRGDGTRLQEAKPGIGFIAARSAAPVIPALHRGTELAFPRGAWLPRPHRITVRFGAPLRFASTGTAEAHRPMAEFSQKIMEKIAELGGMDEAGTGGSGERDRMAVDCA